MATENNERKTTEIFTRVGEFVKDNAGKLVGALALGGGITADVVRARKHKAVMGGDAGLEEREIETLDENGEVIMEENPS